MKRLTALLGLCGLFGVLPVGCLYDSSDRCGPHQVSISNDRCACEEGFVPGNNGCDPCGENEEPSQGVCVCASGYARATVADACEPIPESLGVACDSEATPCDEGRYPLCHVTDGTSGYCTKDCETSDDCDGGYKCQEDAEGSYCRRPPLGYADMCASDDDCADGEATFCETIQSKVCLVPCAAGDTAGCFVGDSCCSFPGFTVCVPTEQCSPANFGSVVE